jgi:uncharacterized membrane protein YeaQ/YmgE (transglycosylase-associated protein family)
VRIEENGQRNAAQKKRSAAPHAVGKLEGRKVLDQILAASFFDDFGMTLAANAGDRPRPASRCATDHLYWSGVMNLIMWLVLGGVLGWLASIVMKTNDQQGLILNIVVGIVGAFLGGLLLAPLFGTGTINQSDFSIGSLFVSFLGAIILLAIVNFFRRRRGVRT